jgi:hypothetical protein
LRGRGSWIEGRLKWWKFFVGLTRNSMILEDFGARLSIRIVEEASTGAFDLRLGAF